MFADVTGPDTGYEAPPGNLPPANPPPAANPWSPEDDAAARTYFGNYLTGHSDYGSIDDGIRAYQQQRQAGLDHDAALKAAMSTLGWQTPGPVTPPTHPDPTGNNGGNTGPGPNVGGLIQPFGQQFAPPTPEAYPGAPTFTPPTMEDAANDPGYMFGLNQGKKSLESWLSAHGTFNDSSAAEALQDYGRGAATTGYNNVWGRRFQEYQGALGPWQTNTARIQRDNETNWQNSFNDWLQRWRIFSDQRDSTFNHQYLTATA